MQNIDHAKVTYLIQQNKIIKSDAINEGLKIIVNQYEIDFSEVSAELNLNKDEIISKAKSKNIEAKYNENTKSARENKIFGSPSFIVKNELFWGDDRMEDAISWSLK